MTRILADGARFDEFLPDTQARLCNKARPGLKQRDSDRCCVLRLWEALHFSFPAKAIVYKLTT